VSFSREMGIRTGISLQFVDRSLKLSNGNTTGSSSLTGLYARVNPIGAWLPTPGQQLNVVSKSVELRSDFEV